MVSKGWSEWKPEKRWALEVNKLTVAEAKELQMALEDLNFKHTRLIRRHK